MLQRNITPEKCAMRKSKKKLLYSNAVVLSKRLQENETKVSSPKTLKLEELRQC